jgi:DNA-binding MarR family transcriptional regulator
MSAASAHRHRPFRPCPEESLFVEMSRTVDLLSRGPTQLLRAVELSAPQYNVLRILRGTPEGLLCGQISERMITRDPDITRLINRLEQRRLVARFRQDEDRRRILVRIAPKGLALLARLDDPICQVHRGQLGHLGSGRIRRLESLLRACRSSAA